MESGSDRLSLASVERGSHAGKATKTGRFIRLVNRIKNMRRGRVSPYLFDNEATGPEELGISLENLGSVYGDSENNKMKSRQVTQRRYSSLPNIPNEVIADQSQNGNRNRRFSAGSNASRINERRVISVVRRLQQRRVHRLAAQERKSFGFLPLFLAILYYIGITQLETTSSDGACRQFGHKMQLVSFVIMSTLAMVKALVFVKDSWIQFRVKNSMFQFISLGYFATNLATRGSMIRRFSQLGGKATTLMSQVEKVHKTHGVKEGSRFWHGNKVLPVTLVFLSVTASLAHVFFDYYPFYKWNFRLTQSSRAYDTAESLFVWSASDYDNYTNIIETKYSTSFTTESYCLAVIGDILTFAGTLYANILVDLFLVLALEVYYLQKILAKAVQESGNGSSFPLAAHWELYTQIRQICCQIDDIFGPLLKLVHFRNMFFFANLLVLLMATTEVEIWCITAFYSLIRIFLAYYVSWKTSEENHKFEASLIAYWKNHTQLEIHGTRVNVEGVLKDMKLNPIGLGRGEFFVSETFILKMIGAVGTIFIFLSDANGKETFNPTYQNRGSSQQYSLTFQSPFLCNVPRPKFISCDN